MPINFLLDVCAVCTVDLLKFRLSVPKPINLLIGVTSTS